MDNKPISVNANIEDLVRNLMLTLVGNGTEDNLGVLGNVMPAIKRISEKFYRKFMVFLSIKRIMIKCRNVRKNIAYNEKGTGEYEET